MVMSELEQIDLRVFFGSLQQVADDLVATTSMYGSFSAHALGKSFLACGISNRMEIK